jgi:hypothetical protein
MALTELQLPGKTDFYNTMQNIAGEISSSMHRWSLVAAFVNRMDTGDLDAMAVAAGTVRSDLIDMKNLLNNFVSLWNNQAVTPTKDPQAIVNAVRKMSQG